MTLRLVVQRTTQYFRAHFWTFVIIYGAFVCLERAVHFAAIGAAVYDDSGWLAKYVLPASWVARTPASSGSSVAAAIYEVLDFIDVSILAVAFATVLRLVQRGRPVSPLIGYVGVVARWQGFIGLALMWAASLGVAGFITLLILRVGFVMGLHRIVSPGNFDHAIGVGVTALWFATLVAVTPFSFVALGFDAAPLEAFSRAWRVFFNRSTCIRTVLFTVARVAVGSALGLIAEFAGAAGFSLTKAPLSYAIVSTTLNLPVEAFLLLAVVVWFEGIVAPATPEQAVPG